MLEYRQLTPEESKDKLKEILLNKVGFSSTLTHFHEIVSFNFLSIIYIILKFSIIRSFYCLSVKIYCLSALLCTKSMLKEIIVKSLKCAMK